MFSEYNLWVPSRSVRCPELIEAFERARSRRLIAKERPNRERKQRLHIGCTICIEEFDVVDDITALACGHTFHHHCLLQWLDTSDHCSMCRVEVNEDRMIKAIVLAMFLINNYRF